MRDFCPRFNIRTIIINTSIFFKKKKKLIILRYSLAHFFIQDVVVIADSLNYIKGFRYELYCIARSQRTPHCVVHVATSDVVSTKWNSARLDNDYDHALMKELIMRFECPDGHNRWDKPTFTLAQEDAIPFDELMAVLSGTPMFSPTKATGTQPLSATNFLHDLDRITQEVVTVLLQLQASAIVGEKLLVPNSSEKIQLKKPLTMSELRRIRAQFITFTRTHPMSNAGEIATLFVQFINNST